jgi:hypothetical protein
LDRDLSKTKYCAFLFELNFFLVLERKSFHPIFHSIYRGVQGHPQYFLQRKYPKHLEEVPRKFIFSKTEEKKSEVLPSEEVPITN